MPAEDVVRPTEHSTRKGRMNLRTTARQDALIRSAADALDKSVTDFVLDSASTAAEQVLADRRYFVVDDNAWRSFEAALERPAVYKPRLHALVTEPNVFDD